MKIRSNLRPGGAALLSLALLAMLASGCRVPVATQEDGIAGPMSSAPGASQAGEPQAEPHWFACEQDADCVVEAGICQQPTGVNVAFRDVFLEFRGYWGPRLNCTALAQSDDPVSARCVRRRCSVQTDN